MAGANFWGDLIRDLRAEQRLSQRRLAVGAKVNRSTLRRIEEGETQAPIDIVERLLKYMGYELEAMAQASLSERLKRQVEIMADPFARSKIAAQRLLSLAPHSVMPGQP